MEIPKQMTETEREAIITSAEVIIAEYDAILGQ